MADRRREVVRRRAEGGDELPAGKRPHLVADEPAAAETAELQQPGRIVSLTATNFMCHKHLRIDFNHVNFVTGQNGSGKSAVLTAVMLALSARASHTGRGTAVADMIRTGEKGCKLTVTLNNVGWRPYCPERYGDTITVERRIPEKGQSTYHLISHQGKKVSTGQKELKKVLNAFNIQVDSPMTIMTQEMSKNFLLSDDPRKRYRQFLEATSISRIEQGYKDGRRQVVSANSNVTLKKADMPAVEREVEEYKKQVDECENREKLKKKISDLSLQLPWARLIEVEEEVLTAERAKDDSESTLRTLTEKRDQLQTKLSHQEGELQQVVKRQQALKQEQQEQERQQAARRAELSGRRRQRDDAFAALAGARRRLDTLRREKDELVAAIERKRAESQPNLTAEEEERRREMAKLTESIQLEEAAEVAQRTHMTNLDASERNCKQQLVELRQRERECADEIERQRRLVGDYERSQTDPLAVFGGWALAVDRAVTDGLGRRELRKKPIGPVGAYIKLKRGCECWRPLVDFSLKGLSTAYLVDNDQDQLAVSAIVRRIAADEQQKPRVIKSKFLHQVHDVSRHGIDPGPGHVSLWSVLDIEHPVVANAVIDQARPETVLLLKTDDEARQLLAYRARVPHGCREALTLTGYQFYPDPSYRAYPISLRRGARGQWLQLSVQEALREAKEHLADLTGQARSWSVEVERQHDALRKHQTQKRRAENVRQLRQEQLRSERRRLRQLQTQEEAEPINLQALEEEVQEKVSEIASSEEEVKKKEGETKATEEDVKQAEAGFQRASEEPRAAFAQKYSSLESERETVEREVEWLSRRLRRTAGKLDEAAAAVAERTAAVATLHRQREAAAARTTGDRIQPTRSAQEIETRLRGWVQGLQNGARSADVDYDDVKRKYEAAKHKYEQEKRTIEGLEAEAEKLQEMFLKRDRKVALLKKNLANRIVEVFHIGLDRRRLRGQMVFNHEEQRLTFAVRSGGDQASFRDPSQLSGGERSVTMVCFVMAMWSVMPSPFRILDEFDVFMDEVNRKAMHEMLTCDSRTRTSQFVFISPHAVPVKDEDSQVTIYRMQPPERQSDAV